MNSSKIKLLIFITMLLFCVSCPCIGREKINAGVAYEFYLDLENQIPQEKRFETKKLPEIKDEQMNLAYYNDFRPLNLLSVKNLFIPKNTAPKVLKYSQKIPKEYKITFEPKGTAAKITPTHEDYIDAAMNYKNKKKYKDALEAIEKAIAIKPRDMRSHFIKADILRLNGKFRDSALEYTLVIAIDPYCTDAYFNIAKILEGTNHRDLALEYYRYAYSTNPNDHEIRNIILSYEKENLNPQES